MFEVHVYSFEDRSEWIEEFDTAEAAEEFARCYDGAEWEVTITPPRAASFPV